MKYEYLNIVGLMTGTSMDGIDISLVRTNGLDLIRQDKNYFYEYTDNTKKFLMSILSKDLDFNLKRKQHLNEFVTNQHYLALKDLDIIETCDLIGFHGQTIFHDPENKTSVQLGDPQMLAKLLNKDVIFDFRSNDMVLGGQGAPIAPIYHQFIIEKSNLELPSCILNIGGVSNLTYWDGKKLIGFDTGPGNALMDNYSFTHFNKNYDKDGKFASKGTPIKEEIKVFLQNEFFKKPPPKSLDRLSFISHYKQLIEKEYSAFDVMATLTEFTLDSISASLSFLPKKINNFIVTGGGYRNTYLINRLKNKLNINIFNEKQLDIKFDYIEAELIAYLSARSVYQLPFTFPLTTGVSKPSSGGSLYKGS